MTHAFQAPFPGVVVFIRQEQASPSDSTSRHVVSWCKQWLAKLHQVPARPSTFGWHRAAGNAMSPLERLALAATCLSQGVVCPFLAPSILRFACLSACLSFSPSLRLCGAVPVLTSRWPPGSPRAELEAEGHDNTSKGVVWVLLGIIVPAVYVCVNNLRKETMK